MNDDPDQPKSDPEPTAPEVPPLVPPVGGIDTDASFDYEIVCLIGHGGYGEVYLARDLSGAYCAVKVIFRESFEHDRPFEREYKGICKFERVSRAYQNQVQVLHVGRRQDPPQFFYIMELADDQTAGRQIDPATYRPKTLKSELRRVNRLPVKECLRIVIALTRALENLHENGLIHRDIKPANIIFVNGVPKLADIGLVTDRDVSVSYVGTEGYIPPEGPSTVQGDIYSMGKVLYELSTGRDRLDYPELPLDLPEVDDREALLEVNAIIAKACDRDPRRRYPNAREMCSDLVRVQGGRSVRRRKSGIGMALVATAGVVAIAFAFLAWNARRIQSSHRIEAANGLNASQYREGEAHDLPETNQFIVGESNKLASVNSSGPVSSSSNSPDVRVSTQRAPVKGLIAWWPGEGNARDYAGTNHGILSQGTSFASGKLGSAFSFNGSSDGVRVPNSPLWSLGSKSFTITVWAKFGSARDHQALVACDNGAGNNNKWIFWINRGGIDFHVLRHNRGGSDMGYAPFPPALNRWYHLAVTRQSNQYDFFIDGRAVATRTDSHPIPPVTGPLTIGGSEGSFFLNGSIDDVRVYNRALDPSEVQALYANTSTRP